MVSAPPMTSHPGLQLGRVARYPLDRDICKDDRPIRRFIEQHIFYHVQRGCADGDQFTPDGGVIRVVFGEGEGARRYVESYS